LNYKIYFIPYGDTARIHSFTTIYTNDTLVRVDTETEQFGPQVMIKHIELRKYYLLLEFDGKKYAIQQSLPADSIPSKYTFKKKRGKVMIAGQKAKKLEVMHPDYKTPVQILYLPSISAKYLDVLKGIPGLPVSYFVQMEDGFLQYVLDSVEFDNVKKSDFGVPKDFEKISFEEFMERMMMK
jgi:hypothetical protein